MTREDPSTESELLKNIVVAVIATTLVSILPQFLLVPATVLAFVVWTLQFRN
jgi:hypothetical protein